MSSGYEARNGNQEIAFVIYDPSVSKRRRCKLYLGKITVEQREDIRSHLDEIIKCREVGLPLSVELRAWLAKVGKSVHAQLAKHWLVAERVDVTLETLCAHHISRAKAKGAVDATIEKVGYDTDKLMKCFGKDRNIRSFSPCDGEQFIWWLKENYPKHAEATRSRTIRRAKEIFGTAVEHKWLKRNPFAGFTGGDETNPDKKVYIPWDSVLKMLEHCDNPRFKLFLVITRTCGIRAPSDVLALKWSHIDRDLEMMRVPSKKNRKIRPWRDIPIFNVLRSYLSEAFVEAPDGEDRVFYDLARRTHQALKGRMQTLCTRAGLAMWPNPFNNLRTSGERDMWRFLKFDEVSSILDHKPETAMKHYNCFVNELRAHAEGRIFSYPDLGFRAE